MQRLIWRSSLKLWKSHLVFAFNGASISPWINVQKSMNLWESNELTHFKDWGFLRKFQKMHFPNENDWIKKLMVPSESAPQELSNEWPCRYVSFNFIRQFLCPALVTGHHQSLKSNLRLEIHKIPQRERYLFDELNYSILFHTNSSSVRYTVE
jgi:hypothetical protein